MKYKQTPSQTIGPFFAYGLTPEQYGYPYSSIASSEITSNETEGEQIIVSGRVLDGDGNAVDDAMLEFWQADHKGKYNKENQDKTGHRFRGFGRTGTGSTDVAEYSIKTIKPGHHGEQAPHINIILFMRGMLNHQFTRIYFSDEEANETDPLLNLIPELRRNTLIAKKVDKNEVAEYKFDIWLQGKKETVFFDV